MGIRGNRVKTVRRSMQALAILAISMLVIAGCSSGAGLQEAQAGAAAESANQALKRVKIAEFAKVQISEPQEQVADVVASAQVDIVAKAGAEVREVVKERGARVKKGEPIILLDDTDARLQQQQALLSREGAQEALSTGRKQWHNSVDRMEQAVSEATKAYNKMRNDYDLGLVGQSELDQAESAYTNAKNELALLKESSVTGLELQVKSSELAITMSERQLANHEITAPIDGILTDLPVQAGMTVSPGYSIGQIQQIDPIKIKALLTAQSADSIRGKSQLAFYVPGRSETFSGQITYLAEVIDTRTNAYELNLSVDNPDLVLKPGMKVQVRLTEAAEEQVVGVPTLSIVREGADSYVFVLSGDKAEKRKVELGRLNELTQEILSGVQAGEQLIVSGQHQLTDGEQVQAEREQ